MASPLSAPSQNQRSSENKTTSPGMGEVLGRLFSPSPQNGVLPVERPLLATLYRTMGLIVVAAGTLGTIWALLAAVEAHGRADSIVVLVSTFAGTCFSSLLLFGVAQIITYIGRITVATEQTALHVLGTGSASSQGGKASMPPVPAAQPLPAHPQVEAVQPRVDKLVAEVDEQDPKVHCPHCNVRIRVATLRRGPNVCPGCYQEFEVE